MARRICKRIIGAIALSVMVGCTPVVKYVDVHVPVPVPCPSPPVMVAPQLPIRNLVEGDRKDHDKVAKAYAASIVILEEAVKERDVALGAYRK